MCPTFPWISVDLLAYVFFLPMNGEPLTAIVILHLKLHLEFSVRKHDTSAAINAQERLLRQWIVHPYPVFNLAIPLRSKGRVRIVFLSIIPLLSPIFIQALITCLQSELDGASQPFCLSERNLWTDATSSLITLHSRDVAIVCLLIIVYTVVEGNGGSLYFVNLLVVESIMASPDFSIMYVERI